MKEIAILILSYLIGSILIGDIVALLKRVDLRGQGSGNVGATNVFRTMGPLYGSIVLVGDTLKGIVAVLLGGYLGSINGFDWGILTGILAIIGHNWSVFAAFRGGKGMATSLGVIIAIAPLSLFVAVPVWILTFVLSGYVSLASVFTAIAYLISVFIFYPSDLYKIIFAIIITAFAIYKHIPNFKRLRQGEEHRFLYKNQGGTKSK